MSVIRDVVTNRNDHSGNETNAFKSYLSTLDPYHLWPISEKLEKKVFSADFEACDVHMHNLRSGKLIHVQVVRNPNLETIATR